ncbi:hypothetical protein BGZ94_004829 [Podila epigama]|nr:hypothetical protein BGZ94_004829 [Podila epigama]
MAALMSLNLNLAPITAPGTATATATTAGTAVDFGTVPADISTQTPPTTSSAAGTTGNTAAAFSISDFLVSGLQSKAWEDWQGVDDMADYSAWTDCMDTQDFSSDLEATSFPYGFDGLAGNMPIWGNAMVPAHLAYDEFTFDLSPSAMEPPTTVNIADLIVGPNSAAPSVSPSELSLPTPFPADINNYQDLALASLYGFTEPSRNESTSGSDLEDDECEGSDDNCGDEGEDEDDDENDAELQAALLATAQEAKEAALLEQKRIGELTPAQTSETVQELEQIAVPVAVAVRREDPNKRRMEEALVTRISNDLGPEHMAGLFRILKGTTEQEEDDGDEDEEMEVDLSCLDETTLVQVYQYAESCCMQTIGSLLAAEQQQREREKVVSSQSTEDEIEIFAAVDTAAKSHRRGYESTPELSTSYSSSSSVSPSPPHPSSQGLSENTKKRANTPNSTERMSETEQTLTMMNMPPRKGKRKRGANGTATPAAMTKGHGGAAKKSRKAAMKEERPCQPHLIQEPIVLHVHRYNEEQESGEDDEIDVVGV